MRIEAENGDHLPAVLRLAYQDHDGGDGAGAGEHGDAEGDDAGIVFRVAATVSPTDSWVGERLASSMSRPMSRRMMPPAISNAGSVMPKMRKMASPAKAKVLRTMRR